MFWILSRVLFPSFSFPLSLSFSLWIFLSLLPTFCVCWPCHTWWTGWAMIVFTRSKRDLFPKAIFLELHVAPQIITVFRHVRWPIMLDPAWLIFLPQRRCQEWRTLYMIAQLESHNTGKGLPKEYQGTRQAGKKKDIHYSVYTTHNTDPNTQKH